MAATSTTSTATMDFSNKIPSTDTSDEVSASLPQALAGIQLRRSLSLTAFATPEKKSSSESGSSGGTDSGYASASTTPTRGVTVSHRFFDKKLSESTQNRFYDLMELFDKPLYDYISKGKVSFTAVSIKLKVLGESEATAQPWIVVLCDKAVSKRVKQFFKQPSRKREYQPRDPDLDFPFFRLVVYDRPPMPLAVTSITEIYAVGHNILISDTLCGTAIKVCGPDDTRIATLGGIIKIETLEKGCMLYGMTAGHVTKGQQKEGEPNSDWPQEEDNKEEGEEEEEEEEDDDDVVQADEELLEPELALDKDQANHEEHLRNDMTQGLGYSAQLDSSWSMIGHISMPPHDVEKDNCNLDWALVEIEDVSDYRPNLLVVSDAQGHSYMSAELREPSQNPVETRSDRPVVLLSGASGHKRGSLSTSLSFLMLTPGKRLTGTYTLVLSDGTALKAGDCGSWVVDAVTQEVYGHVVASDIFGEAYIVPLNATFQQMKKSLAAESVCLPTRFDLRNWRKQYGGTPAKDLHPTPSQHVVESSLPQQRRRQPASAKPLPSSYYLPFDFEEDVTTSLNDLGLGRSNSTILQPSVNFQHQWWPSQSPPSSDSGYSTMLSSPSNSIPVSPEPPGGYQAVSEAYPAPASHVSANASPGFIGRS